MWVKVVRFCPRCGAPMIPHKNEDGSTTLECNRCGYKVVVNKSPEDYRIRYHVGADKKIRTSKAVEARKTAMSPEEREMLREYYEIFLESLQEESSEE